MYVLTQKLMDWIGLEGSPTSDTTCSSAENLFEEHKPRTLKHKIKELRTKAKEGAMKGMGHGSSYL